MCVCVRVSVRVCVIVRACVCVWKCVTDLYSDVNEIKQNEMNEVRNMQKDDENVLISFGAKNLTWRSHFGDPGVSGRKILNSVISIAVLDCGLN